MKILHISDVHFCISYQSPKNPYERMLEKMTDPRIHLETCLKAAWKTHQPDLLVITGDLSDGGTAKDYRQLRQTICGLVGEKQPVLITPGNHDRKDQLREGWLSEPPSLEPWNSVYESEDTLVISLDSSREGDPDGLIDERQAEWLRDTASGKEGKQIILMTHHHLDPKQAEIPPVKTVPSFGKVLEQIGPACILTGHTHYPAQGKIGEIPYYTAPGMSFVGISQKDGRLRFEEQWGYSWYRIENGRVKEAVWHTFTEGNVIHTFRWE